MLKKTIEIALGISFLCLVILTDCAAVEEEINHNLNNSSFTWEKLLSEPIEFQDIIDNEDATQQDGTKIQEFLVNFGRSLDHCNLKIEETAEISQYLIRQYMDQILSRKRMDDSEDELISEDILKAVDFDEEVNFILHNHVNDAEGASAHVGIWSSLHDVLVTFTEACDDLPVLIAEVDIETQHQTGEQAETVLTLIVRAMTRWTQKWAIVLRTLSDDFIDTCVMMPRCERNLRIIVEIFSKSLERTKNMNLGSHDGINLHTIIGTTSFWDKINKNYDSKNENSNTEPTDINSFFRARLENMAGIFEYFGGNSDTNSTEYLHSLGIEEIIPEVSPETSARHVLENADPDESAEEELDTPDEDNIRMQRVVAAAVNVLRFPWKARDANKALLSISTEAPLRQVPPTFLSFALESQSLQDPTHKFDCKSKKLLKMMTPLSPAVFRLGGSSANFLTYDPTSTNDVNKGTNNMFGDLQSNSYIYGNAQRRRKSPFASFYRNRYYDYKPYNYNDNQGIYNSYIQNENVINNEVPRFHPKYRKNLDDVNQQNKERSNLAELKTLKNIPKNHPKFKKTNIKEDSQKLLQTSYVPGTKTSFEKHYVNTLSDALKIPEDYISTSFVNHLDDRQQMSRNTRSIRNSNHPKMIQRQTLTSRWNDNNQIWSRDGSSYEENRCNDQPIFNNFTIGKTDLGDLFDMCASLNWTLIFDLNQFYRDTSGRWDPTNAKLIIAEAKQRGADVVWQVGNEPNSYPHAFAFNLSAIQMADDVALLRQAVNGTNAWRRMGEELGLVSEDAIRVVGPDVTRPKDKKFGGEVGTDSAEYLKEFLSVHPGLVDAVTWHQYYVCGRTATVEQFTSPSVMGLFEQQLRTVKSIVDSQAPGTPIWITETGSAYGGGAPGLSNRFAGLFLWVDKLGVGARDGADVIARQSLYGKNYAMLDDDYNPNPDYWVSVVHKMLVGEDVLVVDLEGAPETVRLYAHCSKRNSEHYQPGGAVVFGQNSGSEDVDVTLQDLTDSTAQVLLFQFTPALGDLTARDVLLNGVALAVSEDGSLPPMIPITSTADQLKIPGNSIIFWILPQAALPACT